MGVIDERFDRVVPRVDAGGNATDATDVIDARVDSGLVPFDARPPLPPNCNISREVDRDNDGLITCAELNQWLNQGWPQFDPRGYCLPCTEFDLFCDGQFPHSACMERPPRPQSIVWSAMCDRQTGLYNFDNFWVVTCQEGGLGD